MEFFKRLWKKFMIRIKDLVYKKPKDGDYYYLESLDVIGEIGMNTQFPKNIFGMIVDNCALETSEVNRSDVCVQTDISQMNGYIVYKYNLEQFLMNERKHIEKDVILQHENHMIEDIVVENKLENW